MALVLVIACVTGARLEAQTAAATPKAVETVPKALAVGSSKKPKSEARFVATRSRTRQPVAVLS